MQFSSEKDTKLLVWQLKDGSKHAFNCLYNIYSKKMYINLIYIVKSEVVAKELLQELFLRIWCLREQLDPEKSFKSFLLKIGRNLVYDHFRKVSRDIKLTAELTDKLTYSYSHIEEAVYYQDTFEMLNKAINELSPQRKKVFLLCKIEGKSYKEVSESLDISVSTISDHIVKATRFIKDQLIANSNTVISIAFIGYLLSF